MHLPKHLTSVAALCLILDSSSSGAEVRRYSFVGDPPAYDFSCGECSGPPYWVRGQVLGTFEVDLDFENGVGTLHSLDARLHNIEGNFGEGVWQPIDWHSQFFLDPSSRYDRYRPPYSGVLMPAGYRPLGPQSITDEHRAPYIGIPTSQIPTEVAYWLFQGVGFEPAPANSWILYFDGRVPNPDGLTVSIGASFLIYFEKNQARFSYYVPIDDAVPSIAAASATLIPEPSGVTLGALMMCWLCASRSRIGLARRCRRPDGQMAV
jgi:hypothetical protein